VFVTKICRFLGTEVGRFCEEIEASQSWLENFKKRNAIVQKVVSSESPTVSETDCEIWREEDLKMILHECSSENVYICIMLMKLVFSTNIYDKTLTFAKEKCHGECNKDRVIIVQI
jgi:hypothetical protein